MNPENIFCSVVLGNDFDYVLFKTAIYFAESGLNVWLISPEALKKFRTILFHQKRNYLKDYKDLLSHLNSVHLWHKIPNIIILSDFDKYCNLYSDCYNPILSALVSATLLDSISVCSKKKQKPCYLICTCSPAENSYTDRFQVLRDMYFPHVINKLCDKLLFDEIIGYFT
ncbi:hypothetical protein NQ318_012143 [Aromia moschata]|uniref:Uncharacterized protein n=1 Tax=Aromia moschata TaxID=1265417 RepID=A0AAV8Z055_9CUCU|nr:hypothetical protein NQ318_012143 [Aromia moschata]